MTLRWKVNDVSRIDKSLSVEHKHPAWLDLFAVTGGAVGLIILRECFLNLQGDAAAHNANTVDRVDQCLGIGLENIALLQFDHGSTSSIISIIPLRFDFDR